MHKRSPWALGPSPASLPILLVFICLELFLAGCEEKGPFGLSEERFAQVLATKNSAAIVGLPEKALADPGPRGPSTWYYSARWLDDLVPAGQGLLQPVPVPPAAAVQDEIPPALAVVGSQAAPDTSLLGPARSRVRFLYRQAFASTTGLLKKEAGLSLLAASLADARVAGSLAGTKGGQASPLAQALWAEVLAEAGRLGEVLGPDKGLRLARLEALDALARDAELQREVADYRALFPGDQDAIDALLYYDGTSARRLGKKAWAPPLLSLILDRPSTDWTAKALDFIASQAGQTQVGPEVLALGRMRLAVRLKDYGPAWRAGVEARSLVFRPSASKDLVADAGKAGLYSASSREALERFALAWGNYPADRDRISRSPEETEAAWTASFYRARFLRALERWPEAASLFSRLAPLAPGPEDGDAALWYMVDTRLKALASASAALPQPKKNVEAVLKARAQALRREGLAVLREASASWSDGATFSDLADSLLRPAIVARDWAFVGELAAGLGPRLSPALGARAAYVAARALELGLYSNPPPPGPPPPPRTTAKKTSSKGSAKPQTPLVEDGPEPFPAPNPDQADGPTLAPTPVGYYLGITAREGVPVYYRILAEYRIGGNLALLPPQATPGRAGQPALEATPGEVETFIQGFIDLGLSGYAWAEARAREALLDDSAIRRLARAASDKGDYAASMRMTLILQERPSWLPERGDYELIYPRPWLDELRGIRPKPDVPEYILYGLLRSESFFRPDVVSDAGAIGLAQIMPTTAKDIARSLGMANYDLRLPSDNLRMGASYFSSLLRANGGRPLRAMFAYNAGGGRLKRWLADLPGLPDDLLLESLSIEETRQYGRNILVASSYYAELYYGMRGRDAVEGALGPGAYPEP